jgi:hypothetical protein
MNNQGILKEMRTMKIYRVSRGYDSEIQYDSMDLVANSAQEAREIYCHECQLPLSVLADGYVSSVPVGDI